MIYDPTKQPKHAPLKSNEQDWRYSIRRNLQRMLLHQHLIPPMNLLASSFWRSSYHSQILVVKHETPPSQCFCSTCLQPLTFVASSWPFLARNKAPPLGTVQLLQCDSSSSALDPPFSKDLFPRTLPRTVNMFTQSQLTWYHLTWMSKQ